MANDQNKGNWILERIEIDQITDTAASESSSSSDSNNNRINMLRKLQDIDKSFEFNIHVPVGARSIDARELNCLRFINSKTANNPDSWTEVRRKFDREAVEGRLHRDKFSAVIGMEDSKEFAGELYDTLVGRRWMDASKGITIEWMLTFWDDLTSQDYESRLQLFFDIIDKNQDGRLSEDEVREVLVLTASTNKLKKLKSQAGNYAALIMEELDPDHLGYIELWQLETSLREMVASEQESKMKESQTLTKTMMPRLFRTATSKRVYVTKEFIVDNWKRIWLVGVWLTINAILFYYKFNYYEKHPAFPVMGYCVCVAKGAAETLKFNMALILLPVCRRTITWLRSTFLNVIFPFDDSINFHEMVAVGITIGTFLHVLIHLSCDFPRLVRYPRNKFMDTLGPYFNFKQPNYLDLINSIPGLTGVL
ncbi:putative respiratory burst oxidase-like protein J [Bienertia sinuspersici]